MKLKYIIFVLFFSMLFLVACNPSDQAIQEALIKTQTAMPMNTGEPELTSTSTLIPTPTSTQTITLTPTSTQTLTPTQDSRVITIDSKELMLAKEDLPPEAKYYLPNYTWISPHHNSEIISGWGVEEGAKYLEETGRIDGWWVYYLRGTSTVRAPKQVYQNIIQYKTSEGAKLTFTKYGFITINPEYEKFDSNILIGDATNVYVRKEMESSGEYYIFYIVESLYKNYVSTVGGMGYEKQFDLDYVIRIAEIAMEKIKAAPLSEW